MAKGIMRRIAGRMAFITGLMLMILGVAFLFGSLSGASSASILLSFLVVVAGCLLGIFAIKLNKRPAYLFFSSFFLMTGFFLFLSSLGIIPAAFSQVWPLLSVFSGLALFPAGRRSYGRFRIKFVVPAIAFILLGCVMLVFSFGIAPFSFTHFILNWWHLLFVLAGLSLLLLSLGAKYAGGNEPDGGAGPEGAGAGADGDPTAGAAPGEPPS